MDLPESEGLRLVSLDGGDMSAVSQLIILEELMRRIEWERKTEILPCDYFHMMAGVGTGGILAVLLGILRMRIEDAIEQFLDIWENVFAVSTLDPVVRAEKLEAVMKKLLKREGLPDDQKLIFAGGSREGGGCKVFVCAVPASSITLCEKFRSYRSMSTSTNPTIIEAVRATCAIPTMFSPVSIKSTGYRISYITGVYNFNNPAEQMVKEATENFGRSRLVACIVSLGCGQHMVRTVEEAHGVNPDKLTEMVASNCEAVHRDLHWRIGSSDVYHRFRVGPASEPGGGNPIPDPIEGTIIRAKDYLAQPDSVERIGRCVVAAERLGQYTLKDISGVAEIRSGAAHGLPSQSAFFVERPDLIQRMSECLFRTGPRVQRRLVLPGLGGVGKTQITISFLLKFLSRFRHVLFIDGSSISNIESGIVAKVSSLGATYSRAIAREALQVLAHPDHEITQNWAIVCDNVDDMGVMIRQYFPQCDFGTVIIITRNPHLGSLAPLAHIEFGVMSETEAVDVLLQSALHASRPPTQGKEEHARSIAKALGYLPVALVQAGYFIKVHDCMPEYLQRLVHLRPDILNRATGAQLDGHDGIYATLDVIWPQLSIRAQNFLRSLGFFNYTGFPLVLIHRAAARGFLFEPFHFSDQTPQFQQAVQLLCSIFRSEEDWDEQETDKFTFKLKQNVDDLVAQLEKYSLVTRMKISMQPTLRLHPLVHSWIYDRLPQTEREAYRAAAVRLIVCGTGDDDDDIFEFVYPHVALLSDRLGELHVNDRAALAVVLSRGDTTKAAQLWESIREEIAALPGENGLLITVAQLHLADVYAKTEDEEKLLTALRLESDALKTRIRLLPKHNHPMIIQAFARMARGLARNKRPKLVVMAALLSLFTVMDQQPGNDWEAIFQSKEAWASAVGVFSRTRSITCWTQVLKERLERKGPDHHTTLKATEALAAAYESDGSEDSDDSDWSLGWDTESAHNTSATELWISLVGERETTRGRQHPDTLKTIEGLARAYSFQDKIPESVNQWKEVIALRREVQGHNHKETLHAMEQLAKTYAVGGRYDEAEDQWGEVIALREGMQGLDDKDIIRAISQPAVLYERRQKYEEAETQWKNTIARMKNHNPSSQGIFYAMDALARMYTRREQYEEAEEQWKEVIRLRKEIQAPRHKDTLGAMIELGRNYALRKQYDEAEHQLKDVIDVSGGLEDPSVCCTINAMETLAKMDQDLGRHEEAVEWWERVILLRKEVQNRFHKEAPYVREHIGQLIETLSRLKVFGDLEAGLAGRLFQEFMSPGKKGLLDDINQGLLAPGNRGLLSAQHSLAKAYEASGKHEKAKALLAKATIRVHEGFYNDGGIDERIKEVLEQVRVVVAKNLGIDATENEARRHSRQTLFQRFPNFSGEVIEAVFEAMGENLESSIETLQMMSGVDEGTIHEPTQSELDMVLSILLNLAAGLARLTSLR